MPNATVTLTLQTQAAALIRQTVTETKALTASSSNHLGSAAAAAGAGPLLGGALSIVCAPAAAAANNASAAQQKKILCDGPALDGGTAKRATADVRCIISTSS